MRKLILALLVAASLTGGLVGSALAQPETFPGQGPVPLEVCTVSQDHAPWC